MSFFFDRVCVYVIPFLYCYCYCYCYTFSSFLLFFSSFLHFHFFCVVGNLLVVQMLHGELSKLVNRLRLLTGQRISEEQPTVVVKTVDETVLQVLQQSLKRHPCIYHFSRTYEESRNIFLDQLKETFASSTPIQGALETLEWINTVAKDLEIERISSVFEDPLVVIDRRVTSFLKKLGFDRQPQPNQNDLSYACPWNVWLLLLCGPLVNIYSSKDKRAEISILNSTTNIRRNISLIHSDVLDSEAWTSLLHELDGLPLPSVRSVWQAATYFFPSCGTLILWYLRKEIAELKNIPILSQFLSDDDAKKAYKCYLRILNTFYRHLPLCFDCRLYELFFTFIQEFVKPDRSSLLELYRICLQRDVGEQLTSTPLWNDFISVKMLPHANERNDGKVEWKKRILGRMLQTPLKDLDKVKEKYDLFLVSEYRGRLTPEEKAESEKSYNRSRAAAQELSKLMSVTRSLSENVLFLSRPIRLEESAEGTQNEIELWAAWYNIVEYVKRPFLSSGSLKDFERLLRFLMMRAAIFPYQVDSWSEIAFYCLDNNQITLEPQRKLYILQQVTRLSSLFLFHELSIQLLQVDLSTSVQSESEEYAVIFKDAIHFHRDEVLHSIKHECSNVHEAIQHLKSICVLSVAWMNLGLKQNNRFHVRLIARYILRTVDFLSLSLALTKVLVQQKKVSDPRDILQPFHIFCHHWIDLELVRNKAVDEAVIILNQWKEHISSLLKSMSKINCSTYSCGADELFIRSCVSIVQASPEKLSQVVSIASSLVNAIKSIDIEDKVFLGLFDGMCYSFFSPSKLENVQCSFSDSVRRRLECKFSAPQRVDSSLFNNSFYLSDVVGRKAVHSKDSQYAAAVSSDFTFPEESLWATPDNTIPRFFSRRRNRDEEVHTEKKMRIEVPNGRSILNVSTTISSLDELMNKKNSSVMVQLNRLELLISKLPGVFEYNPGANNSEQSVSSNWLLTTLQKCDGL